MADDKKTAFVFDMDKASSYLDDVEAYLMKFNGKPGHNPHIILQRVIQPMREAIASGDKSEELFKSIMALKKEAPVVPDLKAWIKDNIRFPRIVTQEDVSATKSGL